MSRIKKVLIGATGIFIFQSMGLVYAAEKTVQINVQSCST